MVVAILVLAGCTAGRPNSFREKVTQDSKFSLRTIQVDVRSRCPAGDNNYSDAEIRDIFATDVEKHLRKLRKYEAKPSADDIIVDLVVAYQRVNMVELVGCKGGYAGAKMAYQYTLSQNGEIFYTASASDQVANAERRSFVKNLKRIGTNLTGTSGKDEEK